VRYISTRGNAEPLNFEQVLLAGLASDGGLYVPETLPVFTRSEIESWAGLEYPELASRIILPFVVDSIPEADFRKIVIDTYKAFKHPAIAPLVQIGSNDWVLELFQGPTLAFKDFALQLLGRLLDYFLQKRGERAVILGATSGDTGSAAIEGCRHCNNVDIFILHPHNRVSEVQRRQMTTVLEDNVWNLALEGSFDDCQNIVKASFNDQSFLSDKIKLVAVNSINWARIVAQIVYYFYAALAVGSPKKAVSFSVPTGNFGDIFAGYLAKNMGLPVDQLIIATNENDVMHKVVKQGVYKRNALHHTLSPSMDISISSNFERLLFDAYKKDGATINALMQQFDQEGIRLSDDAISFVRNTFDSAAIDDEATCNIIAEVYEHTGYVLDPHSATGIGASRACRKSATETIISLATAHPAKFSEAIEKSGINYKLQLPSHMKDLFEREERYAVLPGNADSVQQFIGQHISP
jgi:threonine synthase